MSRSRALSPAALARVLELAATGQGRDQIAAALRASGLSSASPRTVGMAITAAEARGARLPGPRVGRPRKRQPLNASVPPARQQVGAATPATPTTATALPGPPGAELDLPAELAARRTAWLPRARQLADDAFDRGDPVSARDWMRLWVETAERLHAATPRPPPDPAEDPTNTRARDEVRAKFADLAALLRRDLCPSCRARLGA